MNEQVESVWSIVSRRMTDTDERFCSFAEHGTKTDDDEDEHGQWASDVIVLNKVNRIGMCVDEDVFVRSDRTMSVSFSDRSLLSKSETYRREEWDGVEWNVVMFTCVMEECGKICCIYDRRIAMGIELWQWR